MVQVVIIRPLAVEDSFRYQPSPYGICTGLSGNVTGLPSSTSDFSRQYHSTNASYLFTDSVVK